LIRNLSIALTYPPNSELVLSLCDHEANLASWVQIAKWRNLKIVWWKPTNSTTNPKLTVEDLEKLLTSKTRLVACTHASNILGSITDVRSIAEAVHKIPGALLCVDAVAYAPHGPIDVQALGVDFYSFSWYKLFGPHIAMMYASTVAMSELESLGHYFKEGKDLEEKLGLAGANYECVQSIPEVVRYLDEVGWEGMVRQEEEVQEVLLAFLRGRKDVTIYGDERSDRRIRVPVISFKVKGWASFDVIEEVEKRSKYGCRPGHFYSKRLCDEVLGLENSDDGVIRCSLLHYNTVEEVEGLVKVLEEVIGSGNRNGGEK
jgi:selenocysteine lyase/cysteine desulfurase